MLNVLDLFSGIGGFSLGLERTGGFRTVAFCEIEPYCQAVLRKHWPGVPIYDDVRTLTADRLAADGIGPVDVITGGFPCQDISVAGNLAGLDGERSGLWSEIARLVGELRPRFVIVENVANLLAGPSERPGGWFGRVLGDLACLGYDAEWENIPAAAVGAPHRRERIWIVAHAYGLDVEGLVPGFADAQKRSVAGQRPAGLCGDGGGWWASEPDVGRVVARVSDGLDGGRLNGVPRNDGTGQILRALQSDDAAQKIWWPSGGFGGVQAPQVLLATVCEYEGPPKPLGNVSLAGEKASAGPVRGVWFCGKTACSSCRREAAEQRGREHPDTLRLLSQLLTCDCGSAWLDPTGTPSSTSRAYRLRALGNAVVPQIPELIGRSILEAAA